MSAQALHVVTSATTMARMMYASPAWWGYMGAGDRDRLERFTQRLRSAGFLPGDAPTVDGLASRADDVLFNAIIKIMIPGMSYVECDRSDR